MYERESNTKDEYTKPSETIDSLYEKLNDNFEQPGKPKKESWLKRKFGEDTRGRYIVTWIAVIIIILAAVAIAVPVIIKASLKNKIAVGKAFSNLTDDIEESENLTVSFADIREAGNMIAYGDSYLEYSLNLSGLEMTSATIGLDGDATRLFDDQVMESSDNISVMNVEVVKADIYADGNDVYILAPSLSEEVLSINTETLAKDVNGSVISTMFDIKIPDIDYRPFGDGTSKEIKLPNRGNFEKKYSDEIDALADKAKVSREVERTELILANGKRAICKTYHVTLTGETATDLLRALSADIIKENPVWAECLMGDNADTGRLSVERDITLDVSVDKKGNIREIKTVEYAQINNMAVSLDILMLGDEYAIDSLTATVKTNITGPAALIEYEPEGDGELPAWAEKAATSLMNGRNEIVLKRNIDESGVLAIEASIDGEYKAGLSFRGYLEYDRDSRKMTADIDSFQITEFGKDVIHISGDLTAEPAKKAADEIGFSTDGAKDPLDINVFDLIGNSISDTIDQYSNLIDIIGGWF